MLRNCLLCCFVPFTILTVGLTVGTEIMAAEWPEWRGPGGQGLATAENLPTSWSESENVVWKTPVPGRGWSSPVIDEGRIWITTSRMKESSPEERKRRMESITNSQPVLILDELELLAICLDDQTGEILYEIPLITEEKPDPIHVQNSYATPTPVLHEDRLYCHFGTHGTACVDATTGERLWVNTELHLNHENGPGSSPVFHNNLIIFNCDGSDVQYIAALNATTGEVAWKQERTGELHSNPQLRKAYCTPLLVSLRDEMQLISPGADWVYGYNPDTGEELWKLNYGQLGFSNSARPLFHNGTSYIATGFMKSRLLAIDHSDPMRPEISWTFAKQVGEVPSPILVDGLIYLISDDGGVVTCVEAEGGKQVWQKRIGGSHWASPIYADNQLFFFSKEGETTVLQPGREFKVLARNKLDGMFMATGAAVGDSLYLRTDKAMYRIANQ